LKYLSIFDIINIGGKKNIVRAPIDYKQSAIWGGI